MKKKCNLFRWVVIINLMAIMLPWRVAVFAEPVDIEYSPGNISEIDDMGGGDDDIEGNMENEANEDDNEEGNDEEDFKLPILYIRAINPGYKIDGINNVGEMIEIKKNSDDMILLAGVTVRYTNSSGKETVLVEFPENSYMSGESLLLRLDSAPMSGLSNVTYGTTLALKAGPIALSFGDEVIDSVCWANKEGCEKEFASSTPTTLVRNFETGEFEHRIEYEPEYDVGSYVIIEPDEEQNGGVIDDEDEQNKNEDDNKDENHNQNPDDDKKDIDVIEVKTCAEGYYLNESTGRCKKVVVEKEKTCEEGYYLNEETGRCRKIVVEEEKTCAEGYYLNESTGRCRKIVVKEEKTCAEGYYLNEDTGRCKKIVVEEEKICVEGQYLNPLTGRCKKIETEKIKTCAEGYYLNESTGRCRKVVIEGEKTCKEGYYLNEATGRCKKIVENNGAEYELTVEDYEESSSFVALYAVLGVICVGIIYVVYEFRKEIARFFKKTFVRRK